jgi:ketosteroid isomerase-like protein
MPEESTTPDLEERVRVILEAADRADFDAILGFYAPEAEWVMVELDESFRGVDAIRGFWQDWWSSYEGFRVEPPEIVDLGGGVVLATMRVGGRVGGGSGALAEDLALTYEWSDGVVVRVFASFRLDEARAAAERLAEERG